MAHLIRLVASLEAFLALNAAGLLGRVLLSAREQAPALAALLELRSTARDAQGHIVLFVSVAVALGCFCVLGGVAAWKLWRLRRSGVVATTALSLAWAIPFLITLFVFPELISGVARSWALTALRGVMTAIVLSGLAERALRGA